MDEPTAEELGLQSPLAKQVYGLSRKVRELQATADRRLELLREIERSSKTCPLCHGILVWYGTVAPAEGVGHTDDCRLAKELGDDIHPDSDS